MIRSRRRYALSLQQAAALRVGTAACRMHPTGHRTHPEAAGPPRFDALAGPRSQTASLAASMWHLLSSQRPLSAAIVRVAAAEAALTRSLMCVRLRAVSG